MTDLEISRVPKVVNIDLYAGDGAGIKFTLTDASNTPFPLDGAVISQIRAKRADTDPLLSWTVDMTDPDNGVVTLSLTGAETASLITTPGRSFKGVWDLQYVPTGGEPMTLIQGKVKCYADVTR